MTFDTESTLPVSDTHLQAALSAQFGVATLKPQVPKKRARKYDCGKYGRLNIYQIAQVSGLTTTGVFTRIYAGFRGDELCAPKGEPGRAIKSRTTRPTLKLAIKLGRAFPDRLPSVKELLAIHPMSKRKAQRWRQAMHDAANELEAAK